MHGSFWSCQQLGRKSLVAPAQSKNLTLRQTRLVDKKQSSKNSVVVSFLHFFKPIMGRNGQRLCIFSRWVEISLRAECKTKKWKTGVEMGGANPSIIVGICCDSFILLISDWYNEYKKYPLSGKASGVIINHEEKIRNTAIEVSEVYCGPIHRKHAKMPLQSTGYRLHNLV